MQDVRKTVLASLPACKTMVTEIVARTHDVNHEVRTEWSCVDSVTLFGFELPALLQILIDKPVSVASHLRTDSKLHVGSTCGKQIHAASCSITQSSLYIVRDALELPVHGHFVLLLTVQH